MENVSSNDAISKAPNLKRPFWMAISGLLSFLLALILPAVKMKVLGAPADFFGFQAFAWSIGMGIGGFSNLWSTHAVDARSIFWGMSGLLNIVFLIVPMVFSFLRIQQTKLNYLVVASLMGLTSAVIVPFTFVDPHASVLIGYFAWVVGYGLISSALFLQKYSKNK